MTTVFLKSRIISVKPEYFSQSLNRLTESGRTTSYGYDPNGNITQKVLPNGDTETAAFDALNRTKTQTAVSATNESLYQYSYGHDLAGNVTRVGETYTGDLNNRTVTNIYDPINRLVTEAASGAESVTTNYSYDKANNRVSKVVTGGTAAGTTGYTYNTVNQLTRYSEGARNVALTYDAAGNRAGRTVTGGSDAGADVYSYDFENRLVRLVKGSGGGTGTYVYGYDYRTRRVLRDETQANGVATKVVFSGGTSVQEYANGSTYASVEYLRGSDYGGGVGGILYTLRGTDASYTHENRRGDVVAKTNSSGALTYQAAYQAYGTRTQEYGSTQDRQKGNSKEEDPTGLLNEGFRYRDLETGVFITKDPIGNTLMMPKEKWFVDGKSVSEQEYNEALEPGVPQAGNGPTKTAKDSGAEADAHVAGSEEGAIPGQKGHFHTAAAGFPNLYTYVNDNPWTFFDPEGLRDVVVNIWNAEAPYVFGNGSVGHAEVQETNGKTLLSQFPDPHGSHGKNTTLDHATTLKKEGGRQPDEVYKVHVPDDAKFDAAVKDHTSRASWDKHPGGNKTETNCSVSTADALQKGGLPVSSHLLPGNLGTQLNGLSKVNTPGQKWSVSVQKPAPPPPPPKQ